MAHLRIDFACCLAWSIAGMSLVPPAEAGQPEPAEIRAAIAKGIPLIEASSKEYLKQRECFSCHHQAMPMVMLSEADTPGLCHRPREFPVPIEANHQAPGRREETIRRGQWSRRPGGHRRVGAMGTRSRKPSAR